MRESSFLKPVTVPPRPDKKPKAEKVVTAKKPIDEEIELGDEDIEFLEDRKPGELQEKDVETAFEIKGFKGLEVAATLEKKDERKNNSNDRNQDNIIADPETGIIGVLDGLGGEGHGDLASKSAERAIPEAYRVEMQKMRSKESGQIVKALVEQQLTKAQISDPIRQGEARQRITEMIENALSKDVQIGKKALALLEAIRASNSNVTETKGKTTACVGVVHESKDGARWTIIANVGDSAAYKRRKNGEMVALTQEDSLFNALSGSGTLTPDLIRKMKTEPGKKFPIPVTLEVVKAAGGGEAEYQKLKGKELPMSYKNLKAAMIASLGSENAEPSLSIRRLDPGDELIFGTDGLVDKFEDAKTEETDLQALSEESVKGTILTQRLNNLRLAAKSRTTYKKDDDIALVGVRILEKR